MVHGVTYDADSDEWDGESTIDIAAALRMPASGRIPNPAKLKKAISNCMNELFDYTVRASGTM